MKRIGMTVVASLTAILVLAGCDSGDEPSPGPLPGYTSPERTPMHTPAPSPSPIAEPDAPYTEPEEPYTEPARTVARHQIPNGFYDCYGLDYPSYIVSYKNSLRLIDGQRYEHAFGREGTRMIDSTTGSFIVYDVLIVFSGGTMDGFEAEFEEGDSENLPRFALMLDGERPGITCYLKEDL